MAEIVTTQPGLRVERFRIEQDGAVVEVTRLPGPEPRWDIDTVGRSVPWGQEIVVTTASDDELVELARLVARGVAAYRAALDAAEAELRRTVAGVRDE